MLPLVKVRHDAAGVVAGSGYLFELRSGGGKEEKNNNNKKKRK